MISIQIVAVFRYHVGALNKRLKMYFFYDRLLGDCVLKQKKNKYYLCALSIDPAFYKSLIYNQRTLR